MTRLRACAAAGGSVVAVLVFVLHAQADQTPAAPAAKSVPPVANSAPKESPRPTGIPTSWSHLPAVGQPAQKALAAAPTVQNATASAWGDASAGCFTLKQQFRVPGKPADAAAVAQATQASMMKKPPAGEAPGAATGAAVPKNATPPSGSKSPARWRFQANGLRGVAAVAATAKETDFLHVTSASCFYNGRSPTYCEALCKRIIDAFESAR